MGRLILASSSPRRRELLDRLGVEFGIAPADIDETPLAGEAPEHYVARVAAGKAEAVAARHPDAIVLGADTTVVLGDAILAKAADGAEATRMLEALAGKEHRVLTGTCLLLPDGTSVRRVVETTVIFRPLDAAEIARYVASGEWEGKAGAYGAQGLAAAFILAIHGSYTSVIGLPLAEIAADLGRVLR
jgi:septum formation protein